MTSRLTEFAERPPQGRFRTAFATLAAMVLLLLGYGSAAASPSQWTTHGPYTSTVDALAIDPTNPSILYAGGSGVFRSTNGGTSWRAAGLASTWINALAIDPESTSTLYAGTEGGGVFKSIDGGATWTSVHNGLDGPNVHALAIDPESPATLYAGTLGEFDDCYRDCYQGSGVFKTTDGGESWSAANNGLGSREILALTIDPWNPATIYAGTYDTGVWKSVDGGESWAGAGSGLTSGEIRAIVVAPWNPSILYAGTAYGGVWKSVDGGENWTAVNNGLANTQVLSLAIDRWNPATIYAGTWGSGVFRSVDHGESWSHVSAGVKHLREVSALAFDSRNPSALFAASWGSGIWKNVDGSDHWTAVNAGLQLAEVEALAIAPDSTSGAGPMTLYAGTRGVGVFKSVDSGHSWTPANRGLAIGPVLSLAIDPLTPSVLYTGISGGGVFKSDDGGENWISVNNGLTDPDAYYLAIDPRYSTTVYAGTSTGVFRTDDGGEDWTVVHQPGSIRALAIDPAGPATIYAATYDNVFRSTDAGASWSEIGGIRGTVYALAIDPAGAGAVFVSTSRGVFKSAGQGDPWHHLGTLWGSSLAIDAENPSIVYLGGDGWVVKNRGGESWISVGVGLIERVNALAFVPGSPPSLFAGTSRGVFHWSWDDPCDDPAALCLGRDRFFVDVNWRDFAGNTGRAAAVPVDSTDSSLLWFFDADNWEMLVKVLDGCSFNDRFWVLAAATTNVEYELRVVDTITGDEKSWHNPLGTAAAAITEAGAFATCGVELAPLASAASRRVRSRPVSSPEVAGPEPSVKLGPCAVSETALCLNDQRFLVTVTWRDFAGRTGSGRVVPVAADDSGVLWFFSADNWEMLVKVLDGCGINNRFWVFSAATTNVEYTLRVTDTATGLVMSYSNPLGTAAAAITDTNAFATCDG